jgi:hypothetical protein
MTRWLMMGFWADIPRGSFRPIKPTAVSIPTAPNQLFPYYF